MKRIIFITFLILAFCFIAFPQNEKSNPPVIDPDRFGKMSWSEEKAKLDNFFLFLLDNKKSEGIIEFEFAKTSPISERINRLKKIYKFIDIRKADKKRIIFVISELDFEHTTYWIIESDFQWLKEKNKDHHVIVANEFERKIKELFPKNKNLCQLQQQKPILTNFVSTPSEL